MISKEAFKLYFREINLAHKIGHVPIYYDKKTKMLKEEKRPFRKLFWKFNVFWLWFYTGFIYFRFFQTVAYGETKGNMVTLIVHFLWGVMFTCVVFVDLTYCIKRKQLLQLLNSLILFNNRLMEEMKKSGFKSSVDILRPFFNLSFSSIYVNPFATSLIFFLAPCNPRFFSSVLYSNCKGMSIGELIFFYLIEVYFFGHACFGAYSFIFSVPLVQFALIDTVKYMITQPLTTPSCDVELEKQAKLFRQLQILNIEFHDCFRHLFLPAVTVSGALCTIIPLTGLIKLHNVLGLAGNAGLPFLAFGGITVLLALVYTTGKCSKLCEEKLFEHWKKARPCYLTKWMTKFRKSSLPIRVWFGSFFFVGTTTLLGSAQFCVEQTASLILMF